MEYVAFYFSFFPQPATYIYTFRVIILLIIFIYCVVASTRSTIIITRIYVFNNNIR